VAPGEWRSGVRHIRESWAEKIAFVVSKRILKGQGRARRGGAEPGRAELGSANP